MAAGAVATSAGPAMRDQTLEPGRLGIQVLCDGDDPDGVARERYGERQHPGGGMTAQPSRGCHEGERRQQQRAEADGKGCLADGERPDAP